MSRHCRTTTAVAVLAAWALAGCAMDRDPRKLPFPRLDPRQPFAVPQATNGGALPAIPGAPSQDSTFKDRLMKTSEAGEPQVAERAMYQNVLLAGGVSARLPQDFDRWTWAGGDELTLVLATRQGQLVALIYAEAFSSVADYWSSIESYRFQRTVAPQLTSAALPLLSIPFGVFPQGASDALDLPRPPSPRLVEAIRAQTDLRHDEVVLALDRLTTRTLGRGLGVRGPAQDFTGWKWIGRNEQDVKVRLGRYSGNWGEQEELDEPTRKVLDSLAESSPRFAALRIRVNREPFAGSATGGGSAMLVFGDVTPPAGRGVHLAIVCRLEPACSEEEALAEFLNSLKPMGKESPRTGGGVSLAEIGDRLRQAGIDLELESPISEADLAAVAGSLASPPSPEEESPQAPAGTGEPAVEPEPATPGVEPESPPRS